MGLRGRRMGPHHTQGGKQITARENKLRRTFFYAKINIGSYNNCFRIGSLAGRAPALHAGGQGFESLPVHHFKSRFIKSGFFVCLNPVSFAGFLVYSIRTLPVILCHNVFKAV